MLLIRFPRSKSMLWQYSIIGCTKEHEKTLRATAPSSNILLAQDLGWACAELAPQFSICYSRVLGSLRHLCAKSANLTLRRCSTQWRKSLDMLKPQTWRQDMTRWHQNTKAPCHSAADIQWGWNILKHRKYKLHLQDLQDLQDLHQYQARTEPMKWFIPASG